MKYNAHGLPSRLTIDPLTGAITGEPDTPGRYAICVTATCEGNETGRCGRACTTHTHR